MCKWDTPHIVKKRINQEARERGGAECPLRLQCRVFPF